MDDFYQFLLVPRSGEIAPVRKNLYEIRMTVINTTEQYVTSPPNKIPAFLQFSPQMKVVDAPVI